MCVCGTASFPTQVDALNERRGKSFNESKCPIRKQYEFVGRKPREVLSSPWNCMHVARCSTTADDETCAAIRPAAEVPWGGAEMCIIRSRLFDSSRSSFVVFNSRPWYWPSLNFDSVVRISVIYPYVGEDNAQPCKEGEGSIHYWYFFLKGSYGISG